MRAKVIAEIGINHNGSIDVAKKLIDVAVFAGCDYVKFQKRTPELCVPEQMKSVIRETPWGRISYLDYKKKIEFETNEYDEIFAYCKDKQIEAFASVWDIPSCDFMAKYTKMAKIPSALITSLDLCRYARNMFTTLMISTGMSEESEIETCVQTCNPDIIFHTNSSYPAKEEELNLNYILHLAKKYPATTIGYSGHEFGLTTTIAAVVLGAKYIERHVTLDRAMWGSDQLASVEPHGLIKLIKGIRNVEVSLGTGNDRVVYPSELSKRQSLRG